MSSKRFFEEDGVKYDRDAYGHDLVGPVNPADGRKLDYEDRVLLVFTEGPSKVFAYSDPYEDGGYVSSIVVRFFSDFDRPPCVSLDLGYSFISLRGYKMLLKEYLTVVTSREDISSVPSEYDSGKEGFGFSDY